MQQNRRIGLGTVQFGMDYGISNGEGQTSEEEVFSILGCARKNNIGLLDSASAYGNAEEILGKCGVDSFEIVSKFLPSENGQTITRQLKSSLSNLNQHFIYGYMAHRPLSLIDQPEYWDELLELKNTGKVKKIGYSLNTPEELEKLLAEGMIPDLVQVPYNYFDRRFENAIEVLKKQDCEVHTRSVFLQGLFFMKPGKLSPFFDEIKSILESLQHRGSTLGGDLLNFVLSNKMIDKVIIGVENKIQLQNNLIMLQKARQLPEIHNKISDNILIPSLWPQK
ncbi:aldo/keto reductase [Autumnicola edwardsiae]|uniref:Aldo/keto reductase n=1 Tax=Autumnicola edwardsiae TaxID=3075594 RepID=A0ABU3CTL1_9FLAO|nr:aldo/keto reductase [Zunongwangia sp. F297]MDT0649651.1 aldo/keto reductase [Zunongwangia sp. F297]